VYEFRVFLESIAKFVHGILVGIMKAPTAVRTLSTGRNVTILNKQAKLRSHNFLLYLCDIVGVSTDWYEFLSSHRNFFARDAAPYCAVEDMLMFPAEYDLLIMRKNILDFAAANPEDYFRVSECTATVSGVRTFGSALQKYLVDAIECGHP
jgi:hypothetical protein